MAWQIKFQQYPCLPSEEGQLQKTASSLWQLSDGITVCWFNPVNSLSQLFPHKFYCWKNKESWGYSLCSATRSVTGNFFAVSYMRSYAVPLNGSGGIRCNTALESRGLSKARGMLFAESHCSLPGTEQVIICTFTHFKDAEFNDSRVYLLLTRCVNDITLPFFSGNYDAYRCDCDVTCVQLRAEGNVLLYHWSWALILKVIFIILASKKDTWITIRIVKGACSG